MINYVNEKNDEVEWFEISSNLLQFLATNQFKKKSLGKMYEEANSNQQKKKTKQQLANSVLGDTQSYAQKIQ